MFDRIAASRIDHALSWSPAVALLGPRQVGKSTLARAVAQQRPGSIVLDLERAQSRERLALPEVFLAANRLRRFWRMTAHLHGQLFNASSIANSLGVSQPTVARWLDHLTKTLLLRRLEPYHANLGKRLVKAPKVYVRDSGLLHSLLGISAVNDLLGHPSTGASWEGFCIEQICGLVPAGAQVSFYRTAAGAELDLLVESGSQKIGFEIKFSSAPKLTKGFWLACHDVGAQQAYVVAPVEEGWPVKSPLPCPVRVIGPTQLQAALAALPPG